jgi:hypothetical protein
MDLVTRINFSLCVGFLTFYVYFIGDSFVAIAAEPSVINGPIVIDNHRTPTPGDITVDLMIELPRERTVNLNGTPINIRFWKSGEQVCGAGRANNTVIVGVIGNGEISESSYTLAPPDESPHLIEPTTDAGLMRFKEVKCAGDAPEDVKKLFSGIYGKKLGFN